MLRQDASSTPDLRLFERGDTASELELHLALHTVVVALRVTHQQELHEAPEAGAALPVRTRMELAHFFRTSAWAIRGVS